MNEAPIEEWAAAQRALAEAEIELVRCKLHGAEPPSGLLDRVEAARDRANFLFEVASAHLSSPHDTGPAEL